jgi:hypothetical protein
MNKGKNTWGSRCSRVSGPRPSFRGLVATVVVVVWSFSSWFLFCTHNLIVNKRAEKNTRILSTAAGHPFVAVVIFFQWPSLLIVI